MATIIDGKNRIPFLRGMLAHFLIEHGISFQDAYAVADRVRRQLQKQKDISARDMAALVRAQVQKQFGDQPIGEGVFWAPSSRQLLIEDDDGRTLFSLERLADSLSITGLDHPLAHKIARLIEMDLLQSGTGVVDRKTLAKMTLRMLRKEAGEGFSERFRIWRRFRNSSHPKPLIILIGGASGVGKTSVSVALANHLRISRVVSTDSIRQIMRLMIAPDLMPTLHASSYLAWQEASAVLHDDTEQVVSAFREQAVRVDVGVRAIIERALEENDSIIVDGVHLLPDLLDLSAVEDQAIVVWANLFLDDEKQFSDRFRHRGEKAEQRKAHRYIQNLDSILEIQKHILNIGEAHGVPGIENTDFDETLQAMLVHFMEILRSEMRGS